jgi:hypothetical protein
VVLSAVTFGLGNSFRFDGARGAPSYALLQHRPGHTIASAGENYVIPVDIEEPCTVELAVQGVKRRESSPSFAQQNAERGTQRRARCLPQHVTSIWRNEC